MRIQFCSDLHLGLNPRMEFPELLQPVAPILALLGDIGDPESEILYIFLDWCCRHWSQVLYIPGNHEFWRLQPGTTKTIDSALTQLQNLEKKYKNLKFCWRQKLYSEDGIVLLATPFWCRPTEGLVSNPQERVWVDSDRTFSPALLHSLHEGDLKWLQAELKMAAAIGKLAVILTHYPPSMMLMDKKVVKNPDEVVYASDLDVLIRPPIVAWACGHTHQSINWLKHWETATGESGEVLITTNPFGYTKENINYRTEAVLRIDPAAISVPNEEECLAGMSYKTL